VQIGLKINVKKNKLLRLGLSESEKMMLGNKKIVHLYSFAFLAKTRGVFSQLKKVWKNRHIILQTKIRILEAKVVTGVKYGSKA
jgi:hypothetical protein